MTVARINPLQDSRWDDFVARHPRASVFHTHGWLETLRQTYRYEPAALVAVAAGDKLRSAILYFGLRSWLTGKRMVSLPFTDHCEPLVEDAGDTQRLCESLHRECAEREYGYVELRPLSVQPSSESGYAEASRFFLHRLDLRPSLEELFARLDKASTQRKIRRAEREGLEYRRGNEEDILDLFFPLLIRTRRRHGLPPQPRQWFVNLLRCLRGAALIRVALHNGKPVAAILTLSFRNTVVYKYGCSDERHHPLGGMALVFWRMIQEAKEQGAVEIDLGRTDVDNPGLATFKEHWGATRLPLTYWRFPRQAAAAAQDNWKMRLGTKVFSLLPDTLLAASGRMLYRHFG